MNDPRLGRLARLVVNYSLGVRPGEFVVISARPVAEPLVEEFVKAVLDAGGYAAPRMVPARFDELVLRHAASSQLERVNPVLEFENERCDCRINILSETNTQALSGFDPEQASKMFAAGMRSTTRLLERSAAGEARWNLTAYPTEAYAQDSGMSVTEFADLLFSAALVDRDDPAGEWEAVAARQERLAERMRAGGEVRVVGPDTDLRFSVAGRQWINAKGLRNMPDGEVFTAPVDGTMEGHIRYSYPACYNGTEVSDVRLEFREGSVVKATAASNEAFLHRMLATDEGAVRPGEFAIGTNPGVTRFTRNILFDEKIAGTIHIALGHAYRDCGGVNSSAVHWDMVCDLREQGEVMVDGEPILKDGALLV